MKKENKIFEKGGLQTTLPDFDIPVTPPTTTPAPKPSNPKPAVQNP